MPEEIAADVERLAKRRRAIAYLDETEQRGRFAPPPSLHSVEDELELADPPLEYRVDDLAVTEANINVAAQFKTGKTTLVLNLAKSNADDELFLDAFGVKQHDGVDAFWNAELPPRQWRRWVRDMKVKHPERLAVLHSRGFYLPLSVPFVQDWAVEWLETRTTRRWFIEPFGAIYTGKSENDNKEVGDWLRHNVDLIARRAGVQEVVMTLHTGRQRHEEGSEHSRGATALDDWADVRWIYTADGDKRFLYAFGRDIDHPEFSIGYDQAKRQLHLSDYVNRSQSRADDAMARVVTICTQQPGINKKDLEKQAGLGHSSTAIERAQREGLIRVEDGPNRSQLHHANG